MNLKYLRQLTNEEIIEMFNEIIDKNENGINTIYGFNDESKKRIDCEGNEYLYYEGWNVGSNLPYFYGSFLITDFNFKYWSNNDKMSDRQEEYLEKFRELMARRFGDEYLDDLFLYNVNKANLEREKLALKCQELKR